MFALEWSILIQCPLTYGLTSTHFLQQQLAKYGIALELWEFVRARLRNFHRKTFSVSCDTDVFVGQELSFYAKCVVVLAGERSCKHSPRSYTLVGSHMICWCSRFPLIHHFSIGSSSNSSWNIQAKLILKVRYGKRQVWSLVFTKR